MDEPTAITLVISTGRCGTQWLARTLKDLYPDTARVAHEPLGPYYEPRRFFRAYDDLAAMAAEPHIAAHLDEIGSTLESRNYIETGWPLFPAVPLFIQTFPGRVNIVHLTRHPVPTAISHMVHQCYGGSPRDDDYTRLAALDPFCPGVFQHDYRDRWESLTPYERCLFWWTEVHLYAEEIRDRFTSIPFVTLKSEDMLSGEEPALGALFELLRIPYLDEVAQRSRQPVDRWNHRTQIEFDWRKVFQHERTLALASRLGYMIDDVDEAALERRYKGPPHVEPAR